MERKYLELRLLRGFWPYGLLAYLADLTGMLLPLSYAYLVDRMVLPQDYGNLGLWALLTLTLVLLSAALRFYFLDFMVTKKDIMGSTELSKLSLKNLLGFSVPKYEEWEKSHYYNVVTNSCYTYSCLKSQVSIELFACLLTALTLLAIGFRIEPLVGLYMALTAPLLVASSRFQGARLAEMQKDTMLKQDEALGNMRYIIESKREIRALRKETFFNSLFDRVEDEWGRFVTKLKFHVYLTEKLPSILFGGLSVVYLYLGIRLLQEGRLTEGLLLAGYQYLGYFASPVSRIAEILVRVGANRESVDRVERFNLGIEDREAELYQALGVEEEALARIPSLRFYKNPQTKERLFTAQGLMIPQRGLYLLRGQNGSGKSMFLGMLCGHVGSPFYEGEVGLTQKQGRIALLTYPHLFIRGSFEENLFGQGRNRELEELLNIDFRGKEISTNPINLSLGQRQKMGLLRVLSADSDFVLLDEPLTNLDGETQGNLIEYLGILKGQKCVIVVTHEEDFDSLADGAFLIEGGRLAPTALRT